MGLVLISVLWKFDLDHLKYFMKLFFIYIAALFRVIEKNKEACATSLKDVKATRASKSIQRKTVQGSA